MNDKMKYKIIQNIKTVIPIILATIFGLLVGALVIIISKEDPLTVYGELFQKSFIKPYYLLQTLTRSTPIIVCAIATAAAWRAGYYNIGVEGQMIVGAFCATVVALFMPGPPILVLICSFIAGMAGGALYAMIAAFLNLKFNVSIVISTLMMNYIASNITSYFVNFPLKDTAGDGLASQTPMINPSLRFLKLSSTGTFNIGFFLMILIIAIFLFITKKTVFGYESKMTGFNPIFSKYGGVNEKKTIFKTMAMSGAIAALAGIIEIFGQKYRFIDGMFTSTSYAWTGLMAGLIAGLNPIGIFFTGIFLSGLQVGGQSIQRSTNVPLEMSTVIQSCITLFVSAKLFIDLLKSKTNRKKPDDNLTDINEIGGEDGI